MSARYTIGQLAKAAGVARSTVRYYERIGLLAPAGRTRSNYRFYGSEALERLRFIRAAQSAGFTLGDVSTMLELRDGSLAPCEEVRTLIEHRLDEVVAKIADFQRVRAALRQALARCRAATGPGRCEVIQDLEAVAERTARRA